MPEVELPLLSPLIILAGLLFALGCVMLIDGFVRALFGAVASLFTHIPLVGGLTAGAIHNAEHAISGALGKAVSGIESNIGRQWHNLSRVLGNLWAEQKLIAQNLWHLVQSIGNVATGSDIRHLQRTLINRITHALHTALTAAHDHIGLEHWVKHLIRTTIWPRIHYFTHAIDTTIPREFDNLWGRTKAIEDSIGRLWDRVRALESSVSVAAITAIVATAVAALGLDWLRCNNGASRAGRSGCDLADGLGAVFGLAFAALAVADLRDLVKVAQEVEHVTAETIQELLKV